ncbi:MAG TPA: serine/threonine protein kinase [Polyangiaceae bacterium]|nr:serine/threonine protein kinase [Polyangiaceae bacterium]
MDPHSAIMDGSRVKPRLTQKLRMSPTRYEPIARLAAGGMAEVWKGRAIFQDGGSHPVAIKRVLPHLATEDMYRSMFEDEARLGMVLRHENVVRVYDARHVGGTYIMIMELVDGTSLKGLLDVAHARGAPMPVPSALYVGWQLAKALEYAHSATVDGKPLGIIHRDVSPHNLLLGRNGDVKLADFGLADASVHSTHLGEGMLGGKLGYLAPEMIRDEASTSQIDIFALGIVLWEMLCGRRLFQGATDAETVQAVARCDVPRASQFNRHVTDDLEELLRAILAPDPRKRIASAAECAGRLEVLIHRIDPDVSQRDVALLVGLHLATQKDKSSVPDAVAELLAQELALFSQQGDGGNLLELGAQALDPDSFFTG